MRIDVDRAACAGHGLCYLRAPALLDADDQGDPVLLVDDVPEDSLPTARLAVDSCPERALSLV